MAFTGVTNDNGPLPQPKAYSPELTFFWKQEEYNRIEISHRMGTDVLVALKMYVKARQWSSWNVHIGQKYKSVCRLVHSINYKRLMGKMNSQSGRFSGTDHHAGIQTHNL